MLTYGEIPEGKHLDHKCHNPACVNPSHLRPVTIAENMQNRKGPTKANKSNIRNVGETRNGTYEVRLTIEGRAKYFGRYKTAEEANKVAIQARREHYPASQW